MPAQRATQSQPERKYAGSAVLTRPPRATSAVADLVHNSPMIAAQRKQLEGCFGNCAFPVQRYFTFGNEEYYSAKDVDNKNSGVYKVLSKDPGLLAAARALAVQDEDGGTFKTPKALITYLEKNLPSAIEKGRGESEKIEKEVLDTVGAIGSEQTEPKGWGHTFSNGRHGQDMAANEGKLAIARAKSENQDAIGVWVSNENASMLIRTVYAKIGGKDSAEVHKLEGGVPLSIGIEYTKDGKSQPCSGFFLKVQGGIVITAYPTNKAEAY